MLRLAVYHFSLLTAGLLLGVSLCQAQEADPIRGEGLFVGTVSFSEGGAPCLACHGIAGHELGHAAGASYGPDLTSLYENYGEEGIAAVLEDLSFESMVAIYADKPLSDTEQADLVAFFSKVSGTPPDIGSDLILHVLFVTVLLMILIGALGWRRLQGVRRPLTEQARNAKGEMV